MGRAGLRPRPRGWTLGDLMRLSAGFALVLWLVRFDPTRRPYDMGVMIALVAALMALLFSRIFHSGRCPMCGRGPVGRMAAVPFGLHYYRCTSCGQRMKRSRWLGSPWDASGPEDDAYFQPKSRPVATWQDGSHIEPVFSPQTNTVATLLREKIDREAKAPEAASVVPGECGWDEPVLPIEPGPRPERRPWRGVKHSVANALFQTWDAIRWARHSR